MLDVSPPVAQDKLHYVDNLPRHERSQLGVIVMRAEGDADVSEVSDIVRNSVDENARPYAAGALRIFGESEASALTAASSVSLEAITAQLSRLASNENALAARLQKQ